MTNARTRAGPTTETPLSGKVRYGLIGTGMMGYEHITNLKLMAEAEIAGICDPVAQSIQLAQAFLGDGLKNKVTVYPDRQADRKSVV